MFGKAAIGYVARATESCLRFLWVNKLSGTQTYDGFSILAKPLSFYLLILLVGYLFIY